MEEYIYSEWTAEQWQKSWTINVGKAYACEACGTVIMVTKGGIGVLEPICCGKTMKPLTQTGEK